MAATVANQPKSRVKTRSQPNSAGLNDQPLASTCRKYLQFCIVGATGVVVDMGVLWLLTNTGWNLNLSKVIAAEVAMLNNFCWNDIWTFKKNGAIHARSKLKEFLRFNLICTIGIGLSVALLDAQVYWFKINVYIANLIAIVLVSLWNFFVSAKYGWNASISIKPIHPKSSSGVATVS